MVYRLGSLASTPINSLNLITNMTVVVFLGQLYRRAVGRAANLRADFISLLSWPGMTQITDLNMKPTKLLVDLQILNIHRGTGFRFQ
jgi:hypothetical protein